MYRTRSYRRDMRNRKIARKKRLDHEVHPNLSPWYSCDGKYSKGKIHCSCYMCTWEKRNHIKNKTMLIDDERMTAQLNDM